MQICNCAACLRARKINPREHKVVELSFLSSCTRRCFELNEGCDCLIALCGLLQLNIEVESLEEMSVYLPPAFHENNCEALPGPCDRKPKYSTLSSQFQSLVLFFLSSMILSECRGVRTSYGWTEEEMRVARLKKRQGGLHGSDCECDASPSSDVKSSGSLSEHSQSTQTHTPSLSPFIFLRTTAEM
jgi:hypothetical protein